jgi:low temperature requirement protein LtrA
VPRPLLITLAARDPDEGHRASTPLELFFDLTFVVAVAQASTTLHHELVGGHASEALVAYPIVFFAVLWAWMGFTWFASAYDNDDPAYRVTVFVQMVGVLVFAAGVPRFLEDLDPTVGVVGYVIIRVASIAQWLRVAVSHPEGRACALRYAGGIAACQVVWVALAVSAEGGWWLLLATPLTAVELGMPVWAERRGPTSWNPVHIAERYGLFTIIVLGESVLAASVAVQTAVDEGSAFGELLPVAAGGFLIVASMWWIYFDMPLDRLLHRVRRAFARHERAQALIWGYGHYFVYAAAAAVGAGLAVNVDQRTGPTALTDVEAALTVTTPVAVYLLTVWVLHRRDKPPSVLRDTAAPIVAVAVLLSSWTSEPVLVTGIILAALVAASVAMGHARSVVSPSAPTRRPA